MLGIGHHAVICGGGMVGLAALKQRLSRIEVVVDDARSTLNRFPGDNIALLITLLNLFPVVDGQHVVSAGRKDKGRVAAMPAVFVRAPAILMRHAGSWWHTQLDHAPDDVAAEQLDHLLAGRLTVTIGERAAN